MRNFLEISQSISEGNKYAFKQLFEHFFPGLMSYSNAILKNRHIAEEVVEDVFIKLWERRESLPLVRNISSYLYKAVRYASINELVKRKRHESLSLDDIGESLYFSFAQSESALISREICDMISSAINDLPAKCRSIFRLVKEDGLKYREVASLLNLSEKTVENQMNIAFKKLIEALKITIPELHSFFISK